MTNILLKLLINIFVKNVILSRRKSCFFQNINEISDILISPSTKYLKIGQLINIYRRRNDNEREINQLNRIF